MPHDYRRLIAEVCITRRANTLLPAVQANLLPEPADDAERLNCGWVHRIPRRLHGAHRFA